MRGTTTSKPAAAVNYMLPLAREVEGFASVMSDYILRPFNQYFTETVRSNLFSVRCSSESFSPAPIISSATDLCSMQLLTVLCAVCTFVLAYFQLAQSAGESSKVHPLPPPFRLRTNLDQQYDAAELKRHLIEKFGFLDAFVARLPQRLIPIEELRPQLEDPEHIARFLQLGDYREQDKMRLAVPVVADHLSDASQRSIFAFITVQHDSLERPEVLIDGFASVYNAERIQESLKSDVTDHLGYFESGKVLSIKQVLNLLHTFPYT